MAGLPYLPLRVAMLFLVGFAVLEVVSGGLWLAVFAA